MPMARSLVCEGLAEIKLVQHEGIQWKMSVRGLLVFRAGSVEQMHDEPRDRAAKPGCRLKQRPSGSALGWGKPPEEDESEIRVSVSDIDAGDDRIFGAGMGLERHEASPAALGKQVRQLDQGTLKRRLVQRQ